MYVLYSVVDVPELVRVCNQCRTVESLSGLRCQVSGVRCQVPGAGCKVFPDLFPLSVCCCFCCSICVAKQNKLTRTGRQLRRGLSSSSSSSQAILHSLFQCPKTKPDKTHKAYDSQQTSFIARGVFIRF